MVSAFARWVGRFSSWRGSCAALLVVVVVGLGFGDAATGEARRDSAYADPEKPAISYILSDEANVAEFEERFSLSDEDVESVLAAIREENAALSRVRGESQQMIESNNGRPREEIEAKIEGSGYDEKLKEAVARTKSSIERVLPANRRPEFRAWVDVKWQREREEFNEEPSTYRASSGRTFTVFATQYIGYTSYEVALPHRKLKFDGGYEVAIASGGSSWAWAPVKEVGPWNTYDNYWDRRKSRTMWRDLARGLPEAQAAFYNNYNRGRDEFGRKVLNPAGVDLTPAVAREIGLKKYENAWIYVYMPWVR